MPSRITSPRLLFLLAAILLGAAGCETSTPPPAPAGNGSTSMESPDPLTVLVVDDPPLGQAIAREWTARTEGELTIQGTTWAELSKAARLPGDVVVFPNAMIGHLAERGFIVPLDEKALGSEEFDRREIFEQVRLRDVSWGNRAVAVPLGSPHFLLAYRKDVFQKLELAPPQTWQEYERARERLADRAALGDLAPPADQPWRASLEPLSDGWAGQVLLARAAAYASHRDQVSCLWDYQTAQALIDKPPYVRALDELVAANRELKPEQYMAPEVAWQELLAGHAAMALTWPPPSPDAAKPRASLALGFAVLPGSKETFNFATGQWEDRRSDEAAQVSLLGAAGRLAAITSTTSRPDAAQDLLVWLAGREASRVISPASHATTLFRESQIPSASRWTGLDADAAGSYSAALAQSQSLPRSLALRLPGRDEYLAALDSAVHQALSGRNTPEKALQAAAKQWNQITDTLGRDQQREASRRSLGLSNLPHAK